MTVVRVQASANPKSDPALLRVGLSDGSLFFLKTYYLSPGYAPESLCVAEKELSGDEEEALRFAAACCRAEKIALGLIARAEQSVFGLSHKLERRGHAAPCVRAVIAHLQALEIVSDARFASRWVLARLTRTTASPRDLTLALYRRGISRNTAQAAVKSALSFEAESALLGRYLRKNHPGDGGATAWKDSFLRRSLKYAGFSPELLRALQDGEGP